MQTYRWTLTMALSIVHRATGIALYFGTLLLAWWLIAAASGPGAYANVQAFTGSIIGRLIVFGYTWALMHHLLSGLRHFVWDLGYGFKASEREALTWGALIGGISLTVLVWIVAYTDRRRPMNAPKSPSMRTPLARVRSLGSSHSGTGDFWRQRLTAVAMTVLIVPVIVVVLMLIGSNQAGAKQIFSSLPIAIIMLLFIIASAWHMKIGMQVVIEDYVHNEKIKLASVMANNFFCIAVALASIYAILKMSSGV